MNLIENLLLTAGEEAAELTKAFSKANRFGMDSVDPKTELTAAATVVKEYNDILAVIELLRDRGVQFVGLGDPAAVGQAKVRFVEGMEVSTKAGTLVLSESDKVQRPDGVNESANGLPNDEEEQEEEEAPAEEEEEQEEAPAEEEEQEEQEEEAPADEEEENEDK